MPDHQQIQQSKKPDTIFQKQTTNVITTQVSNPFSIIQRAKINPKSLTHTDVMHLQRTIGNRAVGRLLSEIGVLSSPASKHATIQRQEVPEEGPLQGKFERKHDLATCPSCWTTPIVQKQEILEEESLQVKKENNTGMPDNLKAGVESLSGIDINEVRVHYNSSKPAEVEALAYTQGTDIHIAPGQERHLPHEAWHVVQQAQGRVRPTIQLKEGVQVNDDAGLEHEADVMGLKAVRIGDINVPSHVSQGPGPIDTQPQPEPVRGQRGKEFLNFRDLPSRQAINQQYIQTNTIQCELDKSDLDEIIKNVSDDEWLSSIVGELFEIYQEHRNTINYGSSSQGGAVGFQDYAPFIRIIKDKNFWKEDKIKRQSTILHELTHLAQVKAAKGRLNLDPKDEIAGYQEMNPNKKYEAAYNKTAEWMTPELDYTGKISSWIDSYKHTEIGSQAQKNYIMDRLRYALLKQFEQPTTVVDLYYYMKTMGLTENALYEEIKLSAYTFFQARRGYMPI